MQPFVIEVGEESLLNSLGLNEYRYIISGIEQELAKARNDLCV